jgi:hypothetical protein
MPKQLVSQSNCLADNPHGGAAYRQRAFRHITELAERDMLMRQTAVFDKGDRVLRASA